MTSPPCCGLSGYKRINFNLFYIHLFIAKLPSSCEQYFALNTSKNIAKRINKQLVMIDLDGGGSLKPFNVECKKINNLKKKGFFKLFYEKILLKKNLKKKILNTLQF